MYFEQVLIEWSGPDGRCQRPPVLTTTTVLGRQQVMAKRKPIASFPVDEDRNRFGDWLSGFSDGESCFILTRCKRSHFTTGAAKFVIALRADDRSILELIQSYWQCGSIHRRVGPIGRPQFRLSVSCCADLAEIVVPHFENHPLRAKKRRDFAIWKTGVQLIRRITQKPLQGHRGFRPKWTDANKAEFRAITEALNAGRRYDVAPVAVLHTNGQPTLFEV